MTKVDFKKELKHLYKPSPEEVVIVDVPEMSFLMIDGVGDPNTAQEYKDAIEALYSLSYALKFMVKKGELAIDYAVMPLEDLRRTEEMAEFSMQNIDLWKWTAMIMQPEYVTRELVDQALDQVAKKKALLALSKVTFGSLHEGLSAQIMHVGPYSAEGPTIDKLHNYIKQNEYELREKHHEIYSSDPRRSAPERMMTVVRQPMQ